MTTNTQQYGRRDNSALWIILAIVIATMLAYVAYAVYYPDTRDYTNPAATMNNTTAPETTNP